MRKKGGAESKTYTKQTMNRKETEQGTTAWTRPSTYGKTKRNQKMIPGTHTAFKQDRAEK